MKSKYVCAILAGTVVFFAATSGVTSARAAETVSDQISAATTRGSQAIQDAGESARTGFDKYWSRIEEKRLKNRTADQIVAWALIGVLVAAVIHSFTKLNRLSTLLLGLAGAFVGGIAENLLRLDFGLGPVLISYEELLASLVGGVLLILLAKMLAARRGSKPS